MIRLRRLIVSTALACANLAASAAPIMLNFEVTAESRLISSVAPNGRVAFQLDPGFTPVTFNSAIIFDSAPTSSFGPVRNVHLSFSNTVATTFFGLPSLPDSPFSESLRAANDLGPTSSWTTGTIGSQAYTDFLGASDSSSMQADFRIGELASRSSNTWTYGQSISLAVFSPFSSPDDVELFSEESFIAFLLGFVGTSGAYNEGFTRMNSAGIVGQENFSGSARLVSVQPSAPVPEPATLPLLALALCCIAISANRRSV